MYSQALVQPKASRGVVLSMRVLTVIMTAIWVFFGVGWLTHSKEVVETMHHLGFPDYMMNVIGMTHVLGGLGLLIPNRPRLSEWVFAGLTYDLLLAAISHLSSHDVITNALHPIILIVVLGVLYALRLRTGDNLWSSTTK